LYLLKALSIFDGAFFVIEKGLRMDRSNYKNTAGRNFVREGRAGLIHLSTAFLSFFTQRRVEMDKVKLVAIVVAVALGCPLVAKAQTSVYTASYYTVASCLREGTSGIMANGRRLQDVGVYTAAMWDVPFGTKVRVKNLKNGKEVIVTVCDRGPAKRLVRKGRIIDFNFEAMYRLDGIKQGVIPVEIEILKQRRAYGN
jgi:rare lipoprotein A (peptidoglycan hydrolase)